MCLLWVRVQGCGHSEASGPGPVHEHNSAVCIIAQIGQREGYLCRSWYRNHAGLLLASAAAAPAGCWRCRVESRLHAALAHGQEARLSAGAAWDYPCRHAALAFADRWHALLGRAAAGIGIGLPLAATRTTCQPPPAILASPAADCTSFSIPLAPAFCSCRLWACARCGVCTAPPTGTSRWSC